MFADRLLTDFRLRTKVSGRRIVAQSTRRDCSKRQKILKVFARGKISGSFRETPKDEQASTLSGPAVSPSGSATNGDVKATDQGERDVVVDHYIMSPDVRGTSQDPRATNHEQWIVKV